MSGRGAPAIGAGPLQSIFNFRGPSVSWNTVSTSFEVLPPLRHPWRWERPGCNRELGAWLSWARDELETKGRLTIANQAPVTWVKQEGEGSWAEACRRTEQAEDSTVAILQWPRDSVQLAKRLGGRWPIVERFDDPDLHACARRLAAGDGRQAVAAIFEFLCERITGVSTDLKRVVEAVVEGRSTARFTTHLQHLARAQALAARPSAASALAFLEGVLADPEWWLYRRECVHQLRGDPG